MYEGQKEVSVCEWCFVILGEWAEDRGQKLVAIVFLYPFWNKSEMCINKESKTDLQIRWLRSVPGEGNTECNMKYSTLNLFIKSSEQLDIPLNVGRLPDPSRHQANLFSFVMKDILPQIPQGVSKMME